MKKPLKVLSASFVLGMGVFSSVPAYADTPSAIESKIVENKKEQEKVKKEIERLHNAIKENEKVIAGTEKQIKEKNKKIKELKEEKKELQEKMEKREEQIKNRLRLMQASGGKINYIDVLLGAKSFEDFISRIDAIATLTKADQELIEEQKKDQQQVEKTEKATKEELSKLKEMKVELDGMQAQIKEQKEHAEKLIAQLSEEEQQLLREKLALEQSPIVVERENTATQSENLNQSRNDSTISTNETIANNHTVNNRQNVQSGSNERSVNSGTKAKQKKSKSSYNSAPVKGGNAVSIVTTVGNRFIGNSTYVLGAQDPANGRFDCSGFVQWAFRQAGISVGRSTSELSTQGTRVSPSEMRPGDLVFFDTYKKNGHVGIYLGGGRFIGSQSSTGVAIASMNSSYWKSTFKGHVRRIIQ